MLLRITLCHLSTLKLSSRFRITNDISTPRNNLYLSNLVLAIYLHTFLIHRTNNNPLLGKEKFSLVFIFSFH